ncbi:metallopeptidase family protein [Neoactinobaculum massilliense]|uniref:metallopeptidase family protein n=1 Tax=Neoactinobaculum massilliense TaxID=2364794 RepID=UPI001F14CBAC|nr:metallopeptidase family protein [Neoactinobaculum massilliense]
MVTMSAEEFEDAVGDALDRIPEYLTRLMTNVAIIVQDEPDPDMLADAEGTGAVSNETEPLDGGDAATGGEADARGDVVARGRATTGGGAATGSNAVTESGPATESDAVTESDAATEGGTPNPRGQVAPARELLGLYDGTPLSERADYSFTFPDRLYIFQGPLQRYARDRDDLVHQIGITVVHEVGHFFGLDDAELHRLGWG